MELNQQYTVWNAGPSILIYGLWTAVRHEIIAKKWVLGKKTKFSHSYWTNAAERMHEKSVLKASNWKGNTTVTTDARREEALTWDIILQSAKAYILKISLLQGKLLPGQICIFHYWYNSEQWFQNVFFKRKNFKNISVK